MYPSKNLAHETEAVEFLTDHYRNKINIPGLVKAFARQCQTLENVIWDVIEKFYLANNPVGDQLDALGSIVGVARQGANDATYLQLVKVQIRINRSQGVVEDILQVLNLLGATPHYVEQFLPPWSGSFLVECWNLASPVFVARQLTRCRSGGTYGELHYSTWPDGSDFEFVSRNVSLTGEGTWGSRYSASTGGPMVAAESF